MVCPRFGALVPCETPLWTSLAHLFRRCASTHLSTSGACRPSPDSSDLHLPALHGGDDRCAARDRSDVWDGGFFGVDFLVSPGFSVLSKRFFWCRSGLSGVVAFFGKFLFYLTIVFSSVSAGFKPLVFGPKSYQEGRERHASVCSGGGRCKAQKCWFFGVI